MSTRKNFTSMFLGYQIIIFAFLLVVSGAVLQPGAMAADGVSKFVADELLVQFNAGVSTEKAKGLFKSHGATFMDENMPIRVHRIRVPENARDKVKAALSKNPNVSFAENNYIAESGFIPNDIRYSSQWHLPKISAPEGWDITTGSNSEPIAIIDSGVDGSHPDLAGKVVTGFNFLTDNTDTHDVLGHGTAVAGTAAAGSNNITGVAGLAWENPIMPLVVLNSNDYATYSDIAQAITYAVDMGVRVINISIGGSSSSYSLQNAVTYAWNNGAIVFACAHNYSTNSPYYPAACENAIAVSATTASDTLAGFSNFGSWIDISAPGTSIFTTTKGGGYGSWSGTSFSSPLAAGLAALIFSANPQLSNADVVNVIKQNADDLGVLGFDTSFGYGRINVQQSLIAALDIAPQADITPPDAVIISPANGSLVAGSVDVTVSAEDDTAVATVELYIDNSLYEISYSEPHRFVWDTTEFTEGNHTLKVIAVDFEGNQATSDTVSVTAQNIVVVPEPDTIAPVTSIDSPRNGATVGKVVKIKANATDNEAVSMMEIRIDGELMATSTSGTISCVWKTKKTSKGTHSITVKAFDPSGNMGSSSIAVVVK